MNTLEKQIRDKDIRDLIRRDVGAADVAAHEQAEVQWEREQMVQLRVVIAQQALLSPPERKRRFDESWEKLRNYASNRQGLAII